MSKRTPPVVARPYPLARLPLLRRGQGVLVDGVVTTMEKDELEKMRQDMNVDEATHTAELRAAGWSTQEFEQG